MFPSNIGKFALKTGLAALLLAGASAALAEQKKVLVIDAYHEGYKWSDDIVRGATTVLNGKADVKVIHLDTKRNSAEDAKKAAAEKAKQEIETWKPDAVIACDDNASKYVIVPFFKDSKTPFVFCGINWDASAYGFPCSNVTGMLEVSVMTAVKEQMAKYAKGDRVGFIGTTNETDRKEAEFLDKKFGIKANAKHVNTFDEWKAAYKELQDSCDWVFVVNNAGIKDWNDAEAKTFVAENTKVPSASTHDHMAPFVLVTYAKLGSEQGEWAASTCLEIFGGKNIKDIPVASNQKGQLFVNIPLAGKLNARFPLDTLKMATLIKD